MRTSIKLGHVKCINNTQRKFGSLSLYEIVFVEYKGEQIPLVLTSDEIKCAKERAVKNPEDIPVITNIKPFNWAVYGFIIGLIVGCIIAIY